MVHRALDRSKLYCGTNDALAKTEFPLQPRTGLLYPSSQAKTLSDLPPNEKPQQLVIIDGTWSQARSLVRDLSQLKDLPHYKLTPTQPGQYRIRLEPTDTSLSTVEAAAEALRELEPETHGVDQLLIAFGQMIQRQLDHPRVGREHYSGGPKSGSTINIPSRLLGNPASIVIAYGESGYRECANPVILAGGIQTPETSRRHSVLPRSPLFWVAKRLSACESESGETFSHFLKPDVPLTDSFLRHLELNRDQFVDADSPRQFCEAWKAFLHQGDTVVVYSQGTIGLLENVAADFEKCLALKSINFDHRPRRRTLSEFVEQEKLKCEAADPNHGRAGKRLVNAVALTKYLRRVALQS